MEKAFRFFSNIKGAECETENCKRNAERIKYLIDTSVDPCEDFFQYACSSKNRGKEYPYAREDITLNMTELVLNASGDFSFLKDFYDSCVLISNQFSTEEVAKYCMSDNSCDKEELLKFGSIYQDFREKALYFANVTSWPVLTENWEEKAPNFTWQQLSEDILKYEYYLGAFQYVKSNGSNEGTEHFTSNVFFAPMIDYSVKSSILMRVRKNYTSTLHIIPMTFPTFIKENDREALTKYKELMMTSMKLLGANESIAEEDMNKVLENEKKLAKISEVEYFYDLHDRQTNHCVPLSLDEMNRLFPSCDWIGYINNIMQNPNVTVKGTYEVLVPKKERLMKMYAEINRMSKREQANLLLWRVFAKFTSNFLKTGKEEANAIYTNVFDNQGHNTPRSENCINQIKTFFPNIVDDLTISNYLEPDDKGSILNMFSQIKEEFRDVITESEWMQESTKSEAIQKLNKMKINVGEIHNNVEHSAEVLALISTDNYLDNIRILGNSFWKRMVGRLRAPKDAFTNEAEDNAYYWAIFNQVQINVGLMKGSGVGYSHDLPRALMYGGFTSSTLGHELTHGFDNRGSNFDGHGNWRNWWDDKSKEEFEKKTECMVDQYNNFVFSVDGKNYTANGTNTIGENIADNGGVKIGYR